MCDIAYKEIKENEMFTEQEAEKFADWIIAQEKKMLDARYPISPEIAAMSDDELLAELGA
jgi:hypothetical protein